MSQEHDTKVLNDLITTTIDSADGFERAAKDSDASQFVSMFSQFAQERRTVATRLQDRVRAFGETPNDDGSLTAGVHRRWLDLRDAISRGGDREVVEEVERGEDHIKAKFESALRDDELSPDALAAIREAFQSVKAGHDQASALKHRMQGDAV